MTRTGDSGARYFLGRGLSVRPSSLRIASSTHALMVLSCSVARSLTAFHIACPCSSSGISMRTLRVAVCRFFFPASGIGGYIGDKGGLVNVCNI